jgi:UrcA family protein
MMSVRSILAAAVVAAGLAATPALAQPAEAITVSYADLNLAVATGRNTLDRRIANAAEQLCGYYQPTELTWAAAVRACQTETIALTQPQVETALRQRGSVEVSSADRVIRVNRAAN